MKTKIPLLRNGPEKETLIRTIDEAAGRAGLTSEQFFVALTYWLESVADEVCVGNAVPIPALGKIAPWLEERKARVARYNQGNPYCVPVFSFSTAFRAQVKRAAPNSYEGKKSIQRHRSNNGRILHSHRCVPSTAKQFRDSITRQLEGMK